ncbi:MAG: Lrp/AsnC family transcriptional regulator [Pseudomonadota bacterium]
MGIDIINDRILRIMRVDGRISNAELAEKIGLSPSACLRRVQELERTGVISGYRAVLDRVKLGQGFVAYVAVGLSEHTKSAQKNFEAEIASIDEVVECHNMTGSFEYLLRVETTDLLAYKAFHTDVLGDLPKVSTISTHVVMETTKDARE